MTPDKETGPLVEGPDPQSITANNGDVNSVNDVAKGMRAADARDLALRLAGSGFPVFPIGLSRNHVENKIDKTTLNSHDDEFVHGHLDASTDPDVVERMFRKAKMKPRCHWGVGLVPGGANRLVFDVDKKNGGRGFESLATIEAEFGTLPGRRIRTASGGLHIYMRIPPGTVIGQAKVWEGIDLRSDKGWVVAPGVTSPWGAWVPESGEMGDAPKSLIDVITTRSRKKAKPLPEDVGPGDRHGALVSLAGTMRQRGVSSKVILDALSSYNQEHCHPPKPDDELDGIVEWVMGQDAWEPSAGFESVRLKLPTSRPKPDQQTAKLEECLAVYRKWLHLPDADYIVCALAAVAANILDGDPLWIQFVGPPGSGKTEAVQPLAGLEYVHSAATLTEPALLSGVPKRSTEQGATGGLLRQVGDFGIILTKDFSGVLSLHRDARSAVLAALREVYDGSWSRPVGTGGGKVLHWQGKAGFIGAVTPSIDKHSAVMGALGERFVFYRLPEDDHQKSRQAIRNFGSAETMRAELAEAAATVLADIGPHKPDRLTVEDEDRLVTIAEFVVKARTAVERDGYSRTVQVLPEYEQGTRLALQLAQLRAGVLEVGADDTTAWRIVTKVGLDSIPRLRWEVLTALREAETWQTYADLMTATGIPRATLDLHVEDLDLLDLIRREKTDAKRNNSPWACMLREEVSEAWPDSVHTKSRGGRETPTTVRENGSINNPSPISDDKSCERDDRTYAEALDLLDFDAKAPPEPDDDEKWLTSFGGRP